MKMMGRNMGQDQVTKITPLRGNRKSRELRGSPIRRILNSAQVQDRFGDQHTVRAGSCKTNTVTQPKNLL
jgi:hypothetical protein